VPSGVPSAVYSTMQSSLLCLPAVHACCCALTSCADVLPTHQMRRYAVALFVLLRGISGTSAGRHSSSSSSSSSRGRRVQFAAAGGEGGGGRGAITHQDADELNIISTKVYAEDIPSLIKLLGSSIALAVTKDGFLSNLAEHAFLEQRHLIVTSTAELKSFRQGGGTLGLHAASVVALPLLDVRQLHVGTAGGAGHGPPQLRAAGVPGHPADMLPPDGEAPLAAQHTRPPCWHRSLTRCISSLASCCTHRRCNHSTGHATQQLRTHAASAPASHQPNSPAKV
jgi:hypothetical protein